MIPESQFTKVTEILHEINTKPEQLKRIPEAQRAVLMAALASLEGLSESRDVKSVIEILENYRKGDIPKSSAITKIQKGLQNRLGRVSSAQLGQAAKQAEQMVWLKQGEAHLTAGSDVEAFETLEKAKDKGAHRAYALLGQLFQEKRVPDDQLQKYLNRGISNVTYWSSEKNRKRFNVDDHQELARDFYGEGAAKGDPVAQRKLAESNLVRYEELKKQNKDRPHWKATAISWLKKSAKQGDAEAKLLLSKLEK